MLKAIGQYVGGKVLTAVLVVTSAGGIIWCYKHPEQLESAWSVLKLLAVWVGFVLMVPWAMFFLSRWIVKQDSNAAAAVVLGGYLLADMAAAMFLAGFSGHGTFTWMVLLLGFLSAAVYNFVVCDYQVTRIEQGGSGW